MVWHLFEAWCLLQEIQYSQLDIKVFPQYNFFGQAIKGSHFIDKDKHILTEGLCIKIIKTTILRKLFIEGPTYTENNNIS